MVSIKTVAKACGVSVATVSKALNGQRDISEETRARVQKTAEELGYLPNAAARTLKTKRTHNLGVLFKEEAGRGLTHEYFSGVLDGFKTTAEKQGYDITFINSENRSMSYYEHCRYRGFDGVVIVCADFHDAEVVELMESDLPVVTVDYVHQNCTSVCSDNVQGMEKLVRYVYGKGHRRIAYIHGQEGNGVTRDRLVGFYRAMDELGLPVPGDYVRMADYLEIAGAQREVRALLSLSDRPDCVIFPDDIAAIGGQNVILEQGFKIPEDISVAGYDGTRVSQFLSPRITTIRQNVGRIGGESASRLIAAVERPKRAAIERIVVEGTLLEGESVGSCVRKER